MATTVFSKPLDTEIASLNSKLTNMTYWGSESVTVSNTDTFTITIPSGRTVVGVFIRDWGQPIKYFAQSGTTVTIYLSSALNGGTRANYIYY